MTDLERVRTACEEMASETGDLGVLTREDRQKRAIARLVLAMLAANGEYESDDEMGVAIERCARELEGK